MHTHLTSPRVYLNNLNPHWTTQQERRYIGTIYLQGAHHKSTEDNLDRKLCENFILNILERIIFNISC